MPGQVPLSRPTLRTSVTVIVAILVVLAGTTVVALDHPLAELGVGRTDGSDLALLSDRPGPYVERVTFVRRGPGERSASTYVASRHPNGTLVNVGRFGSTAAATGDRRVADVGSVRTGGEGYVRVRYRPGGGPESPVEDHLLVAANTTYERVPADHVNTGADASYWGLVIVGLQYARSGSMTRNGTTFARYEPVGRRHGDHALLEDDVSGYVLVERETGTIRYANLTVDGGESTSAVVRYESRRDESLPVPAWIDVARSVPPEPPNETLDRPTAAAYRTGRGIALIANGSWTPPQNATVTVFHDGRGSEQPRRTVDLEGRASLFVPTRNGSVHRVFLVPTGRNGDGGLAVSKTLPATSRTGPDPIRMIVDARGINYYDLEVREAGGLASANALRPARLRPANGGGRVLRVDDFTVDGRVPGPTVVTITVGNGTTSRTVTLPNRTLGDDRFALVRTPDGVAVVHDYRLAQPTAPAPPAGIASRRFVANATVTVAVNGVPALRRTLPERATRASETPLANLTTGVSVEAFANVSAADSPIADRMDADDWTGHTLVEVHNWNYRAVGVDGSWTSRRRRCRTDYTCYYRVPDGARVRLTTPNGSVLFDGPVRGRETVSP